MAMQAGTVIFFAIISVLAVSTANVLPVKDADDGDSILFLKYVNNKSYFVNSKVYGYKTQAEAASFCRRYNLRLATIRTDEEREALHASNGVRFPRFHGAYWVGGKDNREFYWTDVNEPVTGQFNWDLQRPFNASCLFALSIGTDPMGFILTDRDCDLKLPGTLCETAT